MPPGIMAIFAPGLACAVIGIATVAYGTWRKRDPVANAGLLAVLGGFAQFLSTAAMFFWYDAA